MKRLMRRFCADQNGATAIEYGLIAALIFLVIVGAVTLFGETATSIFNIAFEAITSAIQD